MLMETTCRRAGVLAALGQVPPAGLGDLDIVAFRGGEDPLGSVGHRVGLLCLWPFYRQRRGRHPTWSKPARTGFPEVAD